MLPRPCVGEVVGWVVVVVLDELLLLSRGLVSVFGAVVVLLPPRPCAGFELPEVLPEEFPLEVRPVAVQLILIERDALPLLF